MALRKFEDVAFQATKSPRKMVDKNVIRLRDMVCAKMIEINYEGFWHAYDAKDALSLKDIASDALSAMGIREQSNHNDGPEVEAIQKVSGGSKGQAWCMYQEQFAIAMAEVLTGIVSLFPRTGSCASARERIPKSIRITIDALVAGSNCIKKYFSTGLGHTGGFNRRVNDKEVELNEGNTTAGANGLREGGGSYLTRRKFPKESDGEWIVFSNPFPPMVHAVPEKPPVVVAPELPKYGITSIANLSFQRAVNKYDPSAKLKEDGKYGPKTKAAVAKIQKKAGMAGTGIAGAKTLKLVSL